MPQYERKDRFYQKAKKEGYPSRAAYKLLEMAKRFGIFKPGSKIVDLGCAPGGWLMVAEEKLAAGRARHNSPRPPLKLRGGEEGLCIIGIDLLPLHYQPGPNVHFIQGDFTDPSKQKKMADLLGEKADWVLSDMSPNLSGIGFKDTSASSRLCNSAFEFACRILIKKGGLIIKIFPDVEIQTFKKKLNSYFKKVSTHIPEATRKGSSEIYLVSTGFKG